MPEGDDWVEFGGQLIWAMGFTSGGAPYGLTVEQFRQMNARAEHSAGWARAKGVLKDVLELSAGPDAIADVGWVEKIGDGLSREVFFAAADVEQSGAIRGGEYVVALPRRDAAPDLDEGMRKELRLLGRLEQEELPFRVSEAVGALPQPGGRALVTSFVRGMPMDSRVGRQMESRPWDVVGRMAAAIHSLNAERFADVVPGHPTRLEHAEAQLRVFDEVAGAEIDDARAWCTEHLPPAEPARLLHSDLLGKNILLALDEPPALIDWEYATLGDPAYELAIVTRGARKPFRIDKGLEKLLEAYQRHGGAPVTRHQVHVHELCLAAAWYRDSLAGDGRRPPHEALATVRRILGHATRPSR